MPSPAPRTAELTIRGPLERSDLPGLYDRVCALLRESGAGVVMCDVRDVEADAVAVDALARLQLGARRNGCQVRMVGASEELRALLALMGLRDVIPD